MTPVDNCFELIQGKDTIVSKQNVRIKNLFDPMKDTMKKTTDSGVDTLLHADANDLLAHVWNRYVTGS